MKAVKESGVPISGFNIVPVIGVTLVLLVIIMVMSPILNLPNLPVELPEAMTRETKDDNLTVSLGADGQISVDMQIAAWKEVPTLLKRMLTDRREDTVVIVRADKNLPYGAVEKLIRLVNRHVGRHPVSIATRQRRAPLEGAE